MPEVTNKICSCCQSTYEVDKVWKRYKCPLCKEHPSNERVLLSNDKEFELKRYISSQSLTDKETKLVTKIRFDKIFDTILSTYCREDIVNKIRGILL